MLYDYLLYFKIIFLEIENPVRDFRFIDEP